MKNIFVSELFPLITKTISESSAPFFFRDDGERLFLAPQYGCRRGDDPLFEKLSGIVPGHLMPREVLSAKQNVPADSPCSVLSLVFPLNRKTARENGAEKTAPSKSWQESRKNWDPLIELVESTVLPYFADRGVPAVRADALEDGWDNNRDTSFCWSERHVAWACGLGSFGLHGALITEYGAAHRLMSFITACEFNQYATVENDPFAACLWHNNKTCGSCMNRCPAGAVTEQGRDNTKCCAYLDELKGKEGYAYGEMSACGLCMTGVPCAIKNPVEGS